MTVLMSEDGGIAKLYRDIVLARSTLVRLHVPAQTKANGVKYLTRNKTRIFLPIH